MGAAADSIGVAIAAYGSGDVIAGCLDSLRQSDGPRLQVVIVDNASPDDTAGAIRAWADRNLDAAEFAEASVGDAPSGGAWLTLLRADANRGFAHATNRALEALMRDPALDLFWLLNPDGRAAPDAPMHFAEMAEKGPFALMGGRIVFDDRPDIVQTDGGRISQLTGRCISVNWSKHAGTASPPAGSSLDYVSGASCIASRAFIERAGLMPEDYFLYYEEVDWAMRRGDLPLVTVPEAVVRHIGGTSTGSAARTGPSSAFATYFNYRSRFRFIARHMPFALPLSIGWSLAKALGFALRGEWGLARAIMAGSFGGSPPGQVRERLGADALAFLKKRPPS